MHTFSKHRIFILFLGCLASFISIAQTTRVWVGAGNWTENTHWAPLGPLTSTSRLEWRESGDVAGFNDYTSLICNRLNFTSACLQSFSISGNKITLADASALGWINNGSEYQQSILAPILFNENGKVGLISTEGIGRLVLNNIELGNNLTSLNIIGNSILGNITIGGSISGNMPVKVGQNQDNSLFPNSTVYFTSDNSLFAGPIQVKAGVLNLQHDNAMGASPTNVLEVSAGGVLELQGGINISVASGKNLYIQNNGITPTSTGAILNVSGTNEFYPNIFLVNSSRIGANLGSVLNIRGSIDKILGVGGNDFLNRGITFSGEGDINVYGTIGQSAGTIGVGGIGKSGSGELTLYGQCSLKGDIGLETNGKLSLGAPNILTDASNLKLNGATFNTNGYDETLGTLEVFGFDGKIILGKTNHQLRFANSTGKAWTSIRKLFIYNWAGEAGETGRSGYGKIYVGNNASGLTEAQLAQIVFIDTTGMPYCQGGTLLSDGELVPAKKPFIVTVTSGTLSYAAYVGDTVKVSGCQFLNAAKVFVGGVEVLFTLLPDNLSLTFVMLDDLQGLITIETNTGIARISTTPMVNLGYITVSTPAVKDWSDATAWQGGVVPPLNRAVTIALERLRATSGIINLGNTLTFKGGSLCLVGDRLIPTNTPVVFGGGTLRVMDRISGGAIGSTPGFSQQFTTLNLQASSVIELDNYIDPITFVPRTTYDTLKFTSSKNISWVPGTVLTIRYWRGNEATAGTGYRIFVGDKDTTLTADQLRQIYFEFPGRCQGAKLLPDGELVPSDAPFINTVKAINTPPLEFLPNQAYYGDSIRIKGCKLDQVVVVQVGSDPIAPFYYNAPDSTISFVYTENLPVDRIKFFTFHNPARESISGVTVSPIGYTTKSNGAWGNISTWLGNIQPSISGKTIFVKNTLQVDPGISFNIDTIKVMSGGKLDWLTNGVLTVQKGLIINSGGSLSPGIAGFLNISPDGIITNNGTFDSKKLLTTNFFGSGTINGSSAITFHNLTINTGTLTLPRVADFSTKLPTITGEFRINGGDIAFTPGNTTNKSGPIYAESSSLVYASGTTQRRSVEWVINGAPSPFSAGFPWHVVVENGTIMVLYGVNTTSPAFTPTVCAGDMFIKNGTLRHDMNGPLEIRGDLKIGEDENSYATLNMGNITGESNLPSWMANNPLNYLILKKSFIRQKNSLFNPRQNRQAVRFEGSIPAFIETPGVTVAAGDTAQSFYSLRINKGAELTILSPIGIRESLDLTAGIVNTSATGSLRIEGAASIINGGASNFINGPLQKVTASSPANASGDFEFKIGKKTASDLLYRPVRIANLTNHNGSTTYTAEFNSTETNATPFPFAPPYADARLYGVWKWQWWNIDRTGIGNARVGINYSAGAEWTAVPVIGAKVGVVKYTGSTWELTENSRLYNNLGSPYPEERAATGSGWVYSDSLVGFSPFSIGWGYESVLPIKLLYFTGNLAGNDVLLKWKIADSDDLKHFIVEHSTDGRNFSALSKVEWMENKEYGWRHVAPGPGVHYYRLQMVEKSGEKSYSRIEMVQIGTMQTVIIGLLQNPVVNQQAIVRVYSAIQQTAEITLYDISGRLLLQTKAQLSAGNNQVSVSVLPLRQANYRLRMRTSDGVEKTMSLNK